MIKHALILGALAAGMAMFPYSAQASGRDAHYGHGSYGGHGGLSVSIGVGHGSSISFGYSGRFHQRDFPRYQARAYYRPPVIVYRPPICLPPPVPYYAPAPPPAYYYYRPSPRYYYYYGN